MATASTSTDSMATASTASTASTTSTMFDSIDALIRAFDDFLPSAFIRGDAVDELNRLHDSRSTISNVTPDDYARYTSAVMNATQRYYTHFGINQNSEDVLFDIIGKLERWGMDETSIRTREEDAKMLQSFREQFDALPGLPQYYYEAFTDVMDAACVVFDSRHPPGNYAQQE